MLAPLTRLTFIKRKFKWAQVKQDAFNKIKRVVACDTLLIYKYFNETSKIHTDASAFQLWAVISHKGKPIAFYSWKLDEAQQQYTVTERDIPSIVETLKEYITTLLVQKLIIYTDDTKLTCKNFNTDRVLIWRLMLKEYVPDIEYIKGEKDIVADALSRLPLNVNQDTTHNSTYQK